MTITEKQSLRREVNHFLTYGFSPHFDKSRLGFQSKPVWKKLRGIGTELWLDTGDIEEAEGLWTEEFSGLTTNNTLLNREIQKGVYDSVIRDAAELLSEHSELSSAERMLELAFILNAWHGLRLVERFEACVSVEEHTLMADDIETAVEYGERFFEICPEKFTVKLPFTPAGVLAARKLSQRGVRVNQTLGFSARQNYVSARIARPAFVNVFLGRLNSFIADNGLGSGCYVGEKATLASQAVIRKLRREYGIPTRQIGASMRQSSQIVNLAGLDVITMPPKVAGDFLYFGGGIDNISDQTGNEYIPAIDEDVDIYKLRLDTLWDVDDKLVRCVDMLEREDLDRMSGEEFVDFFGRHGCGDLMVHWSREEKAVSEVEGKIPRLANWHEKLSCWHAGVDSLMTLAGLNSFAADQKAMDGHVMREMARGVL